MDRNAALKVYLDAVVQADEAFEEEMDATSKIRAKARVIRNDALTQAVKAFFLATKTEE